MKLKVPVELNVTLRELGTMWFVTVTTDTTVPGAVQSPFVKRLYVTVPPAVAVVPVRVAESDTEPPTVMLVAERVVAIVTPPTWLTCRGSHGLVAPLLFASPE